MVLTADTEVVLIAPEGRQVEVATRLARSGFDQVVGYVADRAAAFLARLERAWASTPVGVEAIGDHARAFLGSPPPMAPGYDSKT